MTRVASIAPRIVRIVGRGIDFPPFHDAPYLLRVVPLDHGIGRRNAIIVPPPLLSMDPGASSTNDKPVLPGIVKRNSRCGTTRFRT